MHVLYRTWLLLVKKYVHHTTLLIFPFLPHCLSPLHHEAQQGKDFVMKLELLPVCTALSCTMYFVKYVFYYKYHPNGIIYCKYRPNEKYCCNALLHCTVVD